MSTVSFVHRKEKAPIIYHYQAGLDYSLPFYSSKVQAGFPSPADDYLEGSFNLNERLILHPEATFIVKATGNSMIPTVRPNDTLIVDRSITARHGDIVIAAVDGDLTLKRLYQKDGVVKLVADNPAFLPYVLTEASELVIWGVVIHIIHTPKPLCMP